jgi:hypothetical protein
MNPEVCGLIRSGVPASALGAGSAAFGAGGFLLARIVDRRGCGR